MKPVLLIIFALAFFAIATQPAQACQCVERSTNVCAAYSRADAVFVGHLTGITPADRNSQAIFPTATLHFTVEEPFRGVSAGQIDVATLSGTSCDMQFSKGKRYLIYASESDEVKQLFAGPCTRTADVEKAQDDLNYLRAVARGDAKESVRGLLRQDQAEALSGIEITAQSGDKNFATTTDEDGNFSLPLPGPGKYRVRFTIPFAANGMVSWHDQDIIHWPFKTETIMEYEVSLAKGQCDYREIVVFEIDLHATATVAGNVLTPNSLPVNAGNIYLINSSDSDKFYLKTLDVNGSFKFEGVPVGEYYLVINPLNEAPGEGDPQLSRAYYPNVSDVDKATKIVVTEGAKIENLVLRVGNPLKARTVSGTVVWPDGRPAQKTQVYLYDGDKHVRRIDIDEKGRFSFEAYGDFKYTVAAETYTPFRSRSDRVLLNGDKTTGLKLVLKRVEGAR